MARGIKEGLDYFPLDVQMEDKFKLVEAKFGLEGFALLIKLYQKIYSNGYYIDWEEDNALLFSTEINVDINLINDVINECFARDIFNEDLYDEYKILTSHGIQKRYKKATKRRKKVKIYKQYNLLQEDEINDNIILVDINPSSCTHDDNINQETDNNDDDINSKKEGENSQSKVKESKEKKSKEEQNNTVPRDNYSDVYNYAIQEIKTTDIAKSYLIKEDLKQHPPNLIKKAVDLAVAAKEDRNEYSGGTKKAGVNITSYKFIRCFIEEAKELNGGGSSGGRSGGNQAEVCSDGGEEQTKHRARRI